MNDRNYKQSNTAFLSTVNLHLNAKHHHDVTSDELEIVYKWFSKLTQNKLSYKDAVEEIIKLRDTGR